MANHCENKLSFATDASFPAVHALHLADVVERFQVPRTELFAGSGLTEAELLEPDRKLSVAMLEKLVVRARELTGEPGLGFHLGTTMRISGHGYLGFAAMTSGTVREALATIVRFAPTRTDALGLQVHVEGSMASLLLEELAPLGEARDVVVIALLTGIARLGHLLTGRELAGVTECAFPEPDYVRRFEDMTTGPMRFDQPSNRLLFDASILDLPITTHDPVAQKLAYEQCERELDVSSHPGRIVFRVRELLPEEGGGFRSLDQVARKLGVSSRTLKRKLAELGTSYSALLEAQRRERATMLVRAGDLTVDEIAGRLGYSDAANFIRAFRRWTGMTPKAFRSTKNER